MAARPGRQPRPRRILADCAIGRARPHSRLGSAHRAGARRADPARQRPAADVSLPTDPPSATHGKPCRCARTASGGAMVEAARATGRHPDELALIGPLHEPPDANGLASTGCKRPGVSGNRTVRTVSRTLFSIGPFYPDGETIRDETGARQADGADKSRGNAEKRRRLFDIKEGCEGHGLDDLLVTAGNPKPGWRSSAYCGVIVILSVSA